MPISGPSRFAGVGLALVAICIIGVPAAGANQLCGGNSDNLIVLDRSGSMYGKLGSGEQKWVVATYAISRFVNGFGGQLSLGLMIFPGPGADGPIISGGSGSSLGPDSAGCSEGAVDVPPQPFSGPAIEAKLANTSPTGATPLGNSLTAATNYLAGARGPGRSQNIILISDGEESCDYRALEAGAQAVAQAGIRMFVVGFGSEVDPQQLTELAQIGGTARYYKAENSAELDIVLDGISDLIDCCGNGVIDAGETCDVGIPPGVAGSCPVSCEDGDPCTIDLLSGGACNVECLSQSVVQPLSGDGCCPPGANSGVDSDCAPACGNGFVDAGERCDIAIPPSAPGGCPVNCEDGDPCTNNLLSGGGCNVECLTQPVTQPMNGDGCCPPGAHSGIDGDCSPSCGNGYVDSNETCDVAIAAGQQGSCPGNCEDGDPCTLDILSGGGCHVRCLSSAISYPASGDGCCPPGAHSGIDGDCAASCGNGYVDPGESCDVAIPAGQQGSCSVSCEDGDPCTMDSLAGSGCQLQCVSAVVSAPVSGDGCCPNGANSAMDADCPAGCGNGVVDAGESCDVAIPAGYPGTCNVSCEDGDPCTMDILDGFGCQLQCVSFLIVDPITGDGCCPNGMNRAVDGDCPAFCGNGVVDFGETCDVAIPGGIPGSCQINCEDGNPCTIDMLEPLDCASRCVSMPVLQPQTGDGCCPIGANADVDGDCPANCGNGVLDAGERCDVALPAGHPNACPNACPDDGNPCTEATLIGGGCNARCDNRLKEADNSEADACCPTGVSAESDPDCPPACSDSVTQNCVDLCKGVRCDQGKVCRRGHCELAQAQTGNDPDQRITPATSPDALPTLGPLDGPSSAADDDTNQPLAQFLSVLETDQDEGASGCRVSQLPSALLFVGLMVLLRQRKKGR